MKVFKRSLLPALIASVLASPVALAQDECEELEGTPPGLYTVTDEGMTILIGEDGKTVELKAGEAGFANEEGAKCIKRPPRFMDWPCATDAAQSRRFATYRVEEMQSPGSIDEVIQRYFEIPEVIEPIPDWIDGEYNTLIPIDSLISYATPEYWYHMTPTRPVLDPKRPQILLISLYVGLNKVVMDNNMVNALRDQYGDEPIPVAFLFNDSNTVPISYFGPNVSLGEIMKASKERGIKVATPPVWWLGDYTLSVTIEEFEELFELPALEDISESKQAAIRAEIAADGFSSKPIIVNLFSDTATMMVDQPARVRMAQVMGISRIPTVIMTIEPDMHLARCGPGTPVGMDSSAAISGETTPDSGAAAPPGTAPPPPEIPASPSGDGV